MLIARDTLKPIVLIRNIFYIISFDFIDLHINLMHKLTLITKETKANAQRRYPNK